MGGCRGVAGKPAAAARTRDVKHSPSAIQYSYLSTAPFRVPIHLIWAYMHRQGCTQRRGDGRITGPAAPPSRLGRRGKGMQRPRARGVGGWDGVEDAGEAAAAATYSLPLLFRRPPGDS